MAIFIVCAWCCVQQHTPPSAKSVELSPPRPPLLHLYDRCQQPLLPPPPTTIATPPQSPHNIIGKCHKRENDGLGCRPPAEAPSSASSEQDLLPIFPEKGTNGGRHLPATRIGRWVSGCGSVSRVAYWLPSSFSPPPRLMKVGLAPPPPNGHAFLLFGARSQI